MKLRIVLNQGMAMFTKWFSSGTLSRDNRVLRIRRKHFERSEFYAVVRSVNFCQEALC